MACQHLVKRSSPTKGVRRDPMGSSSTSNSPSHKLKKIHKITPSSISPYSQHFIFSLLPTFSPRFLPPPSLLLAISLSSLFRSSPILQSKLTNSITNQRKNQRQLTQLPTPTIGPSFSVRNRESP